MLSFMGRIALKELFLARTNLARALTGGALTAFAFGGCVSKNVASETVTWQAAEDLDCAPSDIAIKEVRLNIYYAGGCGTGREYQIAGECTKPSNCMAGDVRGMGKGVGP
jgi:hypothetical protein